MERGKVKINSGRKTGTVDAALEKTTPMVSVIINNFNSKEKLERCLSSVIRNNYPNFEVIIVDCLTADIENWVKMHYDGVRVIHLNRDVGPCSQLNLGFKLSSPKSKYVIFMDNDVEPKEDCFRNLIEVMESDSTIGAAQPILLRGRDEVDGAGGFIDPLGYPFRCCFSSRQKLDEYPDVPSEIFYAETALMAVRRDIIQKLPNPSEPFDSDYFIHYQDIDLSWRIWLLGCRIVLVPTSISYHKKRGLSSGLSNLSHKDMLLNTRNKAATLLKNYGLFSLVKITPLLLMFESARMVNLLRCNSPHSIASLRGYFWVLENLKTILRKRVAVQTLIRKVPDSQIKVFIKFNPFRLSSDFNKHYKLNNVC
jgi:GT2 family glycosyltransferase